MQIIIDIPEEIVEWINEYSDIIKGFNGEKMGIIADAIANGTPLPKGHGRMIDADALEMYGSWQLQIIPEGNGKYVETKIYTQRAVDAMPTIIPADKEVSE